MSRKTLPHSIAISRRPSWKKSHNPPSLGYSGAWPHNSGTLVIVSAPIMSTIIGIVANLVSSPTRISRPQPISKAPSRYARNSPAGMPDLMKRPAGAGRVRAEELQSALADEDQADIEADEHNRTRGAGGGQLGQ